MIQYDIETILFDFYGMVQETCWYHGIIQEISGIYRGISLCMQGYGKYTIYRIFYYIQQSIFKFRTIFLYIEFQPSFQPSLRSAIVIIISTPLGHGHHYQYSARPWPSLLVLRLAMAIIFLILFATGMGNDLHSGIPLHIPEISQTIS